MPLKLNALLIFPATQVAPFTVALYPLPDVSCAIVPVPSSKFQYPISPPVVVKTLSAELPGLPWESSGRHTEMIGKRKRRDRSDVTEWAVTSVLSSVLCEPYAVVRSIGDLRSGWHIGRPVDGRSCIADVSYGHGGNDRTAGGDGERRSLRSAKIRCSDIYETCQRRPAQW